MRSNPAVVATAPKLLTQTKSCKGSASVPAKAVPPRRCATPVVVGAHVACDLEEHPAAVGRGDQLGGRLVEVHPRCRQAEGHPDEMVDTTFFDLCGPWAQVAQPGGSLAIHYDAFAARLNHWRQRDQQWFHLWHPPVGSPPVRFNSAFGQLALYEADAYLAMRYTGEDCEHVTAHRTMPGQVFLNPSARCVSFWIPNAGQHKHD